MVLRIDAAAEALNKEMEKERGHEETEEEPLSIKKCEVDYFKFAFIVVKGEWAAGPFSTWEDAERYLKTRKITLWPKSEGFCNDCEGSDSKVVK
jgi:hypothetical protein